MGGSQINGKAQKMGRDLGEEERYTGSPFRGMGLCHEDGATLDTTAIAGLPVIVLEQIMCQYPLSSCHCLKIQSLCLGHPFTELN